ncbi:clathrin coat assembly protein AP180 isoform X2 [Sander lucioperca]|uniref:clathrin coat assembly protein AP180 isoform X2 n=1 Tax=Sander lucioperca TaxID=283035 RepID=UPI001653AFD2|nr:clathrin coat assembly protein AP180 isoform X2 [Sander lucioperca]
MFIAVFSSSSHKMCLSCIKTFNILPSYVCVTFPPHTPPHFFPKDPFAPSDGSTNTASSGLDLFGMMTVENNNLGSSLDACFSSSPSPSPLFTSASITITTTATISAPSAANPATDLFSDLFDSMPDTSFTKADPAPSVDLFTAADMFSSPAPILSSAPPPKIDTGAIMNLFGA